MSCADQILELFAKRGDSQYGHEAVTQREHALQCGFLAEQSGASASLIVAALLHDIGHLLHELPDDAPDQGIDDKHENSGYAFLNRHFDPRVSEPVRLHVAAKRYLCTVDENYENQLSEPSRISLALQGGTMSAEELENFRDQPYWEEAVRLRHWDDLAKVTDLPTPGIDHFRQYIDQLA